MIINIPVNLTTVTVATAALLTAALWVWISKSSQSSGASCGGQLAGVFETFAGMFGTCIIWLIAFGLLLLFRGCA